MQDFSADSFPKNFDFSSRQAEIFQQWKSDGRFHADPQSEKDPYTIVIPPPNVTGALHLGHALNNTLQDVQIRMKRMQGFEALWMPGTDHAGIATQAVVERRLKEEEDKTRHDLGREALVDRIWEWKDQYEKRILTQLQTMGSSCDWDRVRFTLDPICAQAVRTTFFDLFQKGLIYRGKRLVNWDTFLQTAVSDDEVFHEVVEGHFWHFKYSVIDPKPGEPEFVTVATTRPETMLGDTAVAVHPDPRSAMEKALAELNEKLQAAGEKDRELIQSQIDDINDRIETMLPGLELLRDMASDGRKLLLPLLNRELELVADSWAKPELGSGCVKITPAHDPNDYEVGKRQNLPMINILNADGTLNASAGPYAGLNIKESRQKVVADLELQGLLIEVEDREIDLAHSDRSKTPIEPMLTDQWFVKMEELAQTAMDAVTDGRVQIFPERYTKGYLDWLGEKRDWPVSRQLWWGHQIPIWSASCSDQKDLDDHLRQLESATGGDSTRLSHQVEYTAELNKQARVVTEDGDRIAFAVIHVCFDNDDVALAETLETAGFIREQDVLDTWFSSALWPHSTLGWPNNTDELEKFYPTSTLITSRDIITLWVARMVLMGLNNMGQIPFSEVFIHPKILDGYGETMSKSKGNGVDPLDVIEKFGADALRFGLAHLTTETQDVRMPVQFECPHCHQLMDQTKKNRELPVVECTQCGDSFRTQWARTDEHMSFDRGPVVSERFETARNFCNKLWNAARFVMMNLEGFEAAPVTDDELAFEDRWLLSRLNSVTQQVTEGLESYKYADSARVLYDFAWDEFCSFYVEMAKARFQDESSRAVAQRVIAYALDQILRLLHPIIPFITEEIWQILGTVAPSRGLATVEDASDSIMVASWPVADEARIDTVIEERFSKFQGVLGALREIRSRQNIAPRQPLEFSVSCGEYFVTLLQPMEPFFQSMAHASSVQWGTAVEPPATNAAVRIDDLEVFVDLKDFIDVDAEIARNEKLMEKIQGQIKGKESKLGNDNFVSRAPEEVVAREREGLEKLKAELASVEAALESLKSD